MAALLIIPRFTHLLSKNETKLFLSALEPAMKEIP
jgi:hypothetical protein